MNNNLPDLMEVAISAAMGAGRELLDRYGEQFTTLSKESVRDIVSDADIAAENTAIEIVRSHYPNARILSEEKGQTGDSQADDYWIIDALDGSVNYVHQVPLFSVSIAYFREGEVQASSIYVPLADDIYYAAKGLGAFKNKHGLRIQDLPLSQSLFAASFSGKNFDPDRRDQEFLAFGRINDASCGCLRTGSAALNLAFLAEGKLNGCWGKANKHWDIAAGLLLAQEAGAQVQTSAVSQGGDRMNYIAASNSNFYFLSDHVRSLF
jgi:myo-inositol-1(or 4)-monophosphatase